jgi:beta-lactamase regulating signal transducer with metallopeptidase domain
VDNVAETRINISEIKSEESSLINELIDFLKEKTEAEVETTTDAIVVKSEDKNVSRKYVRVLLKKFLHKNELKEYFRIIGTEETLTVKKKKTSEE